MKMAKKIVMVVDDEPLILKVIKDILTPEGFKVVTALGGKNALKKLKSVTPDLILLDFFMPEMSGREFCEKIRKDKKLKDIKVAFLTVATFSKTGLGVLKRLGIVEYIRKPFDYKSLVKKVKKHTDA